MSEDECDCDSIDSMGGRWMVPPSPGLEDPPIPLLPLPPTTWPEVEVIDELRCCRWVAAEQELAMLCASSAVAPLTEERVDTESGRCSVHEDRCAGERIPVLEDCAEYCEGGGGVAMPGGGVGPPVDPDDPSGGFDDWKVDAILARILENSGPR